jgi:ribonuclease HII
MKQLFVVGVDEAGRGPLAGPVAVGVARVPAGFDWGLIPGVGDSKQLSAENRKAIFRRAWQLRRQGELHWSVALVGASIIDERGIVPAIRLAMRRALLRAAPHPNTCQVLLDGALSAPTKYESQTTIIKGDATEPVIGLASILAKVTRDRYMARKGAEPPFAPYQFSTHKGYGTKAHRALIRTHGLSPEHRQTYCKNIVVL